MREDWYDDPEVAAPGCRCEGGCEHDAAPGSDLCSECQKSGCEAIPERTRREP